MVVGGAGAGRTDEIDLLDQGPRRVLLAEENDARHQVVEVGRAERTGEADLALGIVADAHQVDVAGPIDLAAAEEEGIDAALGGAIEEFAIAVGEEAVGPAAEHGDPHRPAGAGARQEGRRAGDRRGRADRHVTDALQQAGDGMNQDFLGARLGHSAAFRSST